MSNDNLSERIRNSMLDAERMSRYYGKIADRMQWRHVVASAITMFGSIGAATVLLAETPYSNMSSAFLFLIVAGTSVFMVVYDPSRKAQVARTTREQLTETGVELGRLWYNLENDGVESDIRNQIEKLETKIDAVTKNDLPTDYALNERCGEEAHRIMESFHPRARERSAGSGGLASEAH